MEAQENKEESAIPVWLDAVHTRFAWGKVRPWQEDPDFSEAAANESLDAF
jgi:hypothetical protein